MRHFLLAIALAVVSAPVPAADVSVSTSLEESGYFGRIDIRDIAKPEVIYSYPIIIERPHPGLSLPEPIYLRVPPGHEKKWRKYCIEYDACGVPVYFVSDRWFNEVYAPRYRGRLKPRTVPTDVYQFNGIR